jgi:hypothetical protein
LCVLSPCVVLCCLSCLLLLCCVMLCCYVLSCLVLYSCLLPYLVLSFPYLVFSFPMSLFLGLCRVLFLFNVLDLCSCSHWPWSLPWCRPWSWSLALFSSWSFLVLVGLSLCHLVLSFSVSASASVSRRVYIPAKNLDLPMICMPISVCLLCPCVSSPYVPTLCLHTVSACVLPSRNSCFFVWCLFPLVCLSLVLYLSFSLCVYLCLGREVQRPYETLACLFCVFRCVS